MDTVTYPHSDVAALVIGHTVPVRLTVKEHRDLVHRYVVNWTPHAVLLDGEDRVLHRIEGYVPPTTFMAQVSIGLGKALLDRKRWKEAAERFEGVLARHEASEAAAEALYWLGVARYRASHEPGDLAAEWKRLQAAYPASSWAERSRVPSPPKEQSHA